MTEQGVIFNSNGKQLVAIEHLPATLSVQKKTSTEHEPINKGVIIVVGGPQTRVGSHRLFVYLARALAEQGITVFRFDYSGAGDSEGDVTAFTDIQADIDSAIQTFQQRHKEVTELALWGLCDAASAILLYLNQYPQQNQIKQLFLVNPWVRQSQTHAKTYLRSYYIKRFLSKEFWSKFLSGKIQAKAAFTDIQGFQKKSQENDVIDPHNNFVTEMLQGIKTFSGQSHIILSANDLTADEFLLLVKSNKYWRKVIASDKIKQHKIRYADHTFSQREQQNQLVQLVCNSLTD